MNYIDTTKLSINLNKLLKENNLYINPSDSFRKRWFMDGLYRLEGVYGFREYEECIALYKCGRRCNFAANPDTIVILIDNEVIKLIGAIYARQFEAEIKYNNLPIDFYDFDREFVKALL